MYWSTKQADRRVRRKKKKKKKKKKERKTTKNYASSRGTYDRDRGKRRENLWRYIAQCDIRRGTSRQRKARQWNALCEIAQQTCRRRAALVDCDRRRRRRLYCGSCCSPLSEIIVEKPIRRGCRVFLPVTVEELQPISAVEGHPWGISAVRWDRDLQWKVRRSC